MLAELDLEQPVNHTQPIPIKSRGTKTLEPNECGFRCINSRLYTFQRKCDQFPAGVPEIVRPQFNWE